MFGKKIDLFNNPSIISTTESNLNIIQMKVLAVNSELGSHRSSIGIYNATSAQRTYGDSHRGSETPEKGFQISATLLLSPVSMTMQTQGDVSNARHSHKSDKTNAV